MVEADFDVVFDENEDVYGRMKPENNPGIQMLDQAEAALTATATSRAALAGIPRGRSIIELVRPLNVLCDAVARRRNSTGIGRTFPISPFSNPNSIAFFALQISIG